MTADNDIVERLRALSRCEHSDLSVGDEAAAEIERLRGGWEEMTRTARQMQMSYVDNHQGDVYHAMQALVVKKGLDPSGPMFQPIASTAPAEANDPAPAMPNGVEGLVALWRQQEDNGEERTEFDKGYEQASGECAEALEAALRAADNRDAAGVDSDEDAYVIDRMGKLLAEIAVIVNGPEPAATRWSYHDLPEKVRALKDAPAAVPAGEAVAWRTKHRDVDWSFTTRPHPKDIAAGIWEPLYITPPAPVQAVPQEGSDHG